LSYLPYHFSCGDGHDYHGDHGRVFHDDDHVHHDADRGVGHAYHGDACVCHGDDHVCHDYGRVYRDDDACDVSCDDGQLKLGNDIGVC
jgi:hypothetical protein